MDFSKVTRVSVIDHRRHTTQTGYGLVLEARDVDVELDLQDDDRTLKVWVRDRVVES